MLGDSSKISFPATTPTASNSGGGGEGGHVGVANNSGGEEEDKGGIRGDEGNRSLGGNRWPRQETMALLKIRSDMDVAFRDATVKGPLWDEVSRKLGELGYNRSAKKCKEKFENVYKYHKRIKESRTGKEEGKTYRFFDQLEAFHDNNSSSSLLSSPPQPPAMPQAPAAGITTTTTTIPMPSAAANPSTNSTLGACHISTVPSTSSSFPTMNPTINPSILSFSQDLFSDSTSSDEDIQGQRKRRRRKRVKWKDFFERLTTEVVQKQEEMQKQFFEAMEKRDRERMVREESWKLQETARINREREILAQERSIAAAKDAAVMALLQKLSEHQNATQTQNTPPPQPPNEAAPPPQQPVASVPALPQPPMEIKRLNKSPNGDRRNPAKITPSSRWPKEEIESLIKLRTNLDSKYQESAPKGPLWEEISAGMRNLGYNRNPKRCKEKWENINKYFKKVKESSKKRPPDSKTCPYFHQLDALYKEKSKNVTDVGGGSSSSNLQLNSVPLMVMPEQQWPPAPPEDDDQGDDDGDDEDEDEDEDESDGYEIVANKGTQ